MKKLTVALVVACASAGAMAQQAGDYVATVGWFHIMPQDSSNNLTTSVINAPINDPLRLPGSFTSPNSGLRVSNANTLPSSRFTAAEKFGFSSILVKKL